MPARSDTHERQPRHADVDMMINRMLISLDIARLRVPETCLNPFQLPEMLR